MIEEIARQILGKENISATEIQKFLEKIEKSQLYDWRDMGDLDNNIGRINITNDKYHTIVERLTNAIDACIEKKAEKYPEIQKFRNPTDVKLFLEKQNDLIDPRDIIVGIYTNDMKRKVNLRFSDKGIGIQNEDLPYKILKLNSSHKKQKDYLMGFYGQGGSSVCSYSEYTVIFSTKNEKTSFTIVRNNLKEKKYQYLIDLNNQDKAFRFNPKEHTPPEERFLPPILKDIDHTGTTVIQIEYDISKNVIADYQKIFGGNMFKSIFKYTLHKPPREKDANRQEYWTEDGLGNRLVRTFDKKHVKSLEVPNFLPKEGIKITYYYKQDGDIENYLLSSKGRGRRSIFLTSNGQTHYRMNSSIIKEAKLSRLENKLIIEVNCNKLSLDTKLKIFTSDRQNIDREVEVKIEDTIKNFLSNDKFLESENKRLEDELLKEGLKEDNEELRQKFAEILKEHNIFGEFDIPPFPNPNPIPPPPIDLFDTPTYFKITNKSNPIEAKIGKVCVLKVESNVDDRAYKINNYFIDIDDSLKEIMTHQTTDIKDGRGQVILEFKDVKVGQRINVTLFLKARNRKTIISNTKQIEIIDAKEPIKPKPNRGNAPDIKQVLREHKAYQEFGWDKEERFGRFDDGRVIYVNMSHSKLEKFKHMLKMIDVSKLENLKQEYFLNMAYAIFMLDQDENFKLKDLGDLDSERIKDAALAMAAQLMFKLLKEKHKIQ